ncbi:MAG: HAD-IIA family hydrolase [Acidimicrobiaceae bacterium]|nr:HAD-IIA family hydrolase [Ilumatobacter sp.]MCB9379980.1 HAD-IIA family hydrolase [Acidimicrobiaceae bacterium]MCO5330635.1 HAD-IIA family hydrolase [Ilumatobacteraceae bacterium]
MFPVLCDLDGVVWLANRPIDGSVDAIARLRAAGHRVLFVTNNSSAEVAVQEAALAAIGVPAEGDVLTSAQAAALLVAPGERAIACAGAGVVEALRRQGAIVLDAGDPAAGDGADAVVVGWHRTFDYERLTRATTALLRGARLVGTNDDATYPTPDGPIPGGGSILAAVATASGVAPTIAGKPYEPMAALVRRTVGDDAARRAVMVGDRPSTDGRFARLLGCRYAHVQSGVTPAGAVVEPTPDIEVTDLAAVADVLLAAEG